jgi:small-conductance mechanosensitive channel
MTEQKPRHKMFETRSHSWRQAGLIRQLNPRAVKRARLEALVFVPAFIAIVIINDHRQSLLGIGKNSPWTTPASALTVAALVALGWAIARDVGRALGPAMFRRMDPGTAGTVGFLVRLATVGVALLIALSIAGIQARTLAVGGAFTAVIVGLAAQQTLGNVIAGVVLLSARPFRVGDRVRIQAGALGGQLEGVVSSLGLLYTVLSSGDDLIMLPNSGVLNAAVVPLREPDAVDLRARLRPGVTPDELQKLLEESIQTPLRDVPRITLEELDGEEVVVRISATPRIAADGPALATELLGIVSRETRAADDRREAHDEAGGARITREPAVEPRETDGNGADRGEAAVGRGRLPPRP